KEAAGVSDVRASFADGTVRVVCGASADGVLEKLIEELDYRVVKNGRESSGANLLKAVWVGIALYELYAILDRFGLLDVFYAFPEAKAGMGYGMLFTVGLLTSVHCVAMCGGINLSQSLPVSPDVPRALRFAVIRSGLLYNLGRAVSYTLIGGLAGALGAAVSPSENVRGYVQLAAGVFMVVMGLNMLNVFPWLRRVNPRMPKIFGDKARSGKRNGPLYVGLLNGLMPCGPLQAMQLYALSTGSLLRGALSMLAFSAGTLPLMFGLSALSSLLSKKFTRGVMTVGAAMVVVLGVAMFGNGMSLTGLSFGSEPEGAPIAVRAESGVVQLVRTELKPGRYDPIKVQAGIPVRWTIHAEPETINGCNNQIVIPEYGRLRKRLAPGDNIVEFTPERTGTFTYTCWMGMIRGKITVVEDGAGNPIAAAEPLPADSENPEAEPEPDPFAELFAEDEPSSPKP
ncbi:MAG: sulfite exporter TauE/SafE family protein, partial [Synergistaceae bacterium]|nr:sulfite exporter TauE/SafE family protein [Synergistaceae bacterium]